jgi:hypothetical protein
MLRLDLADFLPGLALKLDPPDLHLPYNRNYRCEPPLLLKKVKFDEAGRVELI